MSKEKPTERTALAILGTLAAGVFALITLLVFPVFFLWIARRLLGPSWGSTVISVAIFAFTLAAEIGSLVAWHGTRETKKTKREEFMKQKTERVNPRTGEANLVVSLPCGKRSEGCAIPCRNCPIYHNYMRGEQNAGRAPLYEPTELPRRREPS